MKFLFCFILTITALDLSASAITIRNFHSIDPEASIFRGTEPRTRIFELEEFGIDEVIIFKSDTRGEVEREINVLEDLGMSYHHIPFRWKNFESNKIACKQMVQAIETMRDARKQGKKTFIHCTAGEDRTGAVSGLFRILDEGIDLEEAFTFEMCARGYSNGNSHKPSFVTSAIENELTPLFIALAKRIENLNLSLDQIDQSVCDELKVEPTNKVCEN
jgi:protein tyrosine phosphatase (PTP) superfamily phosphohydrolase (DUF442 family)